MCSVCHAGVRFALDVANVQNDRFRGQHERRATGHLQAVQLVVVRVRAGPRGLRPERGRSVPELEIEPPTGKEQPVRSAHDRLPTVLDTRSFFDFQDFAQPQSDYLLYGHQLRERRGMGFRVENVQDDHGGVRKRLVVGRIGL